MTNYQCRVIAVTKHIAVQGSPWNEHSEVTVKPYSGFGEARLFAKDGAFEVGDKVTISIEKGWHD